MWREHTEVETHGFNNMNFDPPGGSATMGSGSWAEMATEERLLANISAYMVLEKQLMQVIAEQGESLLEEESDLHEGLRGMLMKVSALRAQLEHLGGTMGLKECAGDTDEVDRPSGSVFEMKVRGYHLLNELSVWAVRSLRDLRKLQREREKLVSQAEASAESSEL
ncbi:ciliary neurotrophic factor-like isoform X2 [Pseudophryne corroboree]|uniref:ciliary neurotrophic factor-like isoform X2 n=1 Tax=Pseudophryne corroboree TaxID=495146 RepID=UPI0030819589